MDSWPSFAWLFLIVKLFHFLQYRILVESTSDCMTRWTRHLNDWPSWIKENCVQHLFRTYGSLGNTWVFLIFSLPLLIISPFLWLKHGHPGFNTCSQLEITRLLQPLYVFKSSRARLRRVFCSSVGKWGTHLAQTFLKSKCFFRIVCTLPSDMPVQLAISLTDNRASCSTIFTAAMLALVAEVLGLPGRVSSSTENFPALKALTHLKTVCIEMVWSPYIPHNSLNICFESILSLMQHLI